MGTYAQDTEVPADRSRSEIERTLARYGARRFMYGWEEERAVVGFELHERQIRFELPLPNRDAPEFTHTPARGTRRSTDAAEKAYDQAVRQRWRALALVIKAKLEAVETGIVTFDQEFGMHFLLPGGHTLGQVVLPQLEAAYATGSVPALLPGGAA